MYLLCVALAGLPTRDEREGVGHGRGMIITCIIINLYPRCCRHTKLWRSRQPLLILTTTFRGCKILLPLQDTVCTPQRAETLRHLCVYLLQGIGDGQGKSTCDISQE